MDWFEQLTGFAEMTGSAGYQATRNRLAVDGQHLLSTVNGRRYGIGKLELVSLETLRHRARSVPPKPGCSTVQIVQGDVRLLHAQPRYSGALFQVASQFNLLEMVGPQVTPEDGVTGYAADRTQGPACAIAAGAATIYRNYFAVVGGVTGQSQGRQLDAFLDFGTATAQALGRGNATLWDMRNGYAMFQRGAVELMSAHVQSLDEPARDALRRRLQIGVHWDVEVTDAQQSPGPMVSQAFCSALPVAYNRGTTGPDSDWAPLATLVLEAAYEATLWAAVLNAQRGTSRAVLLTLLGGGAFGNDEEWILDALRRALRTVRDQRLELVVVSYGPPSAALRRWVDDAAQAALRD